MARWIERQIETGLLPADEDWSFAFRDVTASRLRELAETLGLAEQGRGGFDRAACHA